MWKSARRFQARRLEAIEICLFWAQKQKSRADIDK
jgi:hypothetical protein